MASRKSSKLSSIDSDSPLEIILETGEDHPGKRKRNRARVSCINCYVSKRKCDRKRPCTRCINLGLTGLCAYELDDPLLRHNKELDGLTHLKNRISELESVLRQLKKRPHPSWCSGGLTHDLGIFAARRTSRRRSQENLSPCTSVETFFATVAESDGNSKEDSDEVKIEESESLDFVPQYTLSETGYPEDSALTSNQLQGSSPNAPFTFDEPHSGVSTPCPPLTTFIQSVRREGKFSSFSAESQADHIDFSPTLSKRVLRNVLTPDVGHHLQSGSTDLSVSHRTSSAAIHTSHISSHSSTQPASVNGRDVCQCINTTTHFTPLLHFAMALRTSREALQGHHIASPDCELFRRIIELESHIFNATPPVLESSSRVSQACDSERNSVNYTSIF